MPGGFSEENADVNGVAENPHGRHHYGYFTGNCIVYEDTKGFLECQGKSISGSISGRELMIRWLPPVTESDRPMVKDADR